MIRTVVKRQHITREDVRKERDKVFLFGDNILQIGKGGQAEAMRGEFNAIGIPTKKKPAVHDKAYFTDDEYPINVQYIDAAFSSIPDNSIVVVPVFIGGEISIGRGYASMPDRCPQTYDYLCLKFERLLAGQQR